MKKILDLHIHSKYSRACSPELVLPKIAKACEVRGIDIVSTGDFTHPGWFEHIKENLVEDTSGIYKLKDGSSPTKFIIGTELAVIKKHKDKTRRVHLCVFAPNIEIAEKFNKKLEKDGFNLKSDGRPIIGLTAKQLLELILGVDDRMVMIPAHAWTPWFGILGSKGGYDSLEDAFEELTPHIFAIETGLSSDPLMNWQVPMLDNITLVSNSDAHSLQKLGREANVLDFKDEKDINYNEIMRIFRTGDKKKFLYTIEFYPEEGKYHTDGCRNCHFSCEPEETKKLKGICPKCKKKLTVGVLNRINELSDKNDNSGVDRIPYKSLVPLPEILADTFGCGVNTKKVKLQYDEMISKLGNEFGILLDVSLEDIKNVTDKKIVEAIKRVREGNVYVIPGYDGEFGIVKVFKDKKDRGDFVQVGLELD